MSHPPQTPHQLWGLVLIMTGGLGGMAHLPQLYPLNVASQPADLALLPAARTRELLRTLHRPAGRDHSAVYWPVRGRHGRVLVSACRAAAEHRHSGHRRFRLPPGRGSGDHGQLHRRPAGTASRRDRRRVGHVLDQLDRPRQRHRPLRPRPDTDDAARDVQSALNAAQTDLPSGLPARPTYKKIQSRRLAHHYHRRCRPTRFRRPGLRGSGHRLAPAASARSRASARCRSRAGRRRRCACSSIPGRCGLPAYRRTMCARRS